MNEAEARSEAGLDVALDSVIAATVAAARGNTTWFNSGRAALAFIVESVVRPRRVLLPAICCPCLAATIRQRSPLVQIERYPVGTDLAPRFPPDLDDNDLLVIVHYFGYRLACIPTTRAMVVEDVSHLLPNTVKGERALRFGSCRKLFPIADGGRIEDFFEVSYESGGLEPARMRQAARTWRECQAAETLLNATPCIGDISSGSLTTLFNTDLEHLRATRRKNELLLREGISVGTALRPFADDEVPLAHVRLFESREQRDILREHLAAHRVYASLQWDVGEDQHPLEPGWREANDWADRHLAFAIGQHLNQEAMLRTIEIANTCQGIA